MTLHNWFFDNKQCVHYNFQLATKLNNFGKKRNNLVKQNYDMTLQINKLGVFSMC